MVLCLTFLVVLAVSSQHTPITSSHKVPQQIYQWPLGLSGSSAGDPYWYQTGAMGSSSSNNYVAASVSIRTVYDRVNGDAHSYWVGGFIANSAFVQVGFLNEMSTNNESYCCAWFYEYFYSSGNCCEPIIGPENSAGPMGSWHNYTLSSNNDGTWSFYLDQQPLGTTPNLGGSAAANSGSNAPAALAEVAGASSNTDIIGPGEFKNLSFRTAGSAWKPVASANSFIWYGKGSFSNGSPPPNPYGAMEVEGRDNDFLAGSYIPPLAAPSQTPGPSLWPSSPLTIFHCCISVSFLDDRNSSFDPSWASFQSSSGDTAFFSQYENQLIRDGTWTLKMAVWHSEDVAQLAPSFTTPGITSPAFQTHVFSIQLRVVGLLTGIPISGASITTTFPDTASQIVRTDDTGNAVIVQLPTGPYALRIAIPYGIPAALTSNVTAPVQLTARIFGPAEVALIVGSPISVAILITIVAVSRERRKQVEMPMTYPVSTPSGYCTSCGQPFYQGQLYCTNCGTQILRTPA
jgi:hypothetical protein